MKASIYREYDALAYNPKHLGEERGAINHIKKAKQKAKGLEIVFDPKGHREFVTGFRRRKEQRRKVAKTQLEAKDKKKRSEERAERRQKLKVDLGLPDNYGVANSSGSEDEDTAAQLERADVKVYRQGELTTTVAVVDMEPEEHDEPEVEEAEDNDQQQQQQQPQAKGKAKAKHTGRGGVTKHHGRRGKQGQQHKERQDKHSKASGKAAKRRK